MENGYLHKQKRKLRPWKCEKPWKAVSVDGEMPRSSKQERLKLLDRSLDKDLIRISYETVAIQKEVFSIPSQYTNETCCQDFDNMAFPRQFCTMPIGKGLPCGGHRKEKMAHSG
jgi:hypothetical protein